MVGHPSSWGFQDTLRATPPGLPSSVSKASTPPSTQLRALAHYLEGWSYLHLTSLTRFLRPAGWHRCSDRTSRTVEVGDSEQNRVFGHNSRIAICVSPSKSTRSRHHLDQQIQQHHHHFKKTPEPCFVKENIITNL